MRKGYVLACLLAVLLTVAFTVAACGGSETTTTAAPDSTTATAAPSSETTSTVAPSSETTGAPSTETTAAGPATGEPIKIGLNNSLTGYAAAPGVSVSKGVKLEIENINANGGINGRPIELIEYDDKSDIPTAIANLNKLYQEDKVFATIGPFQQAEQEPGRQLAEQMKVPMVGDGPPTLAQLSGTQYQWSVMTSAGPKTQAEAVAKVVAAHGWKNVLGLADVLNVDQETLDVLSQNAAAAGFAFTKMQDTFGFDQQDFQPILNKMREQIDTLKPDALVLYINPIAFPVVYKGLRGLGVELPVLAGTACAHPAIFALGPEAVEGAYTMDSGGMVNPQGLPDSWPVKQMQLDFAQRYQAKYNEMPDFFAGAGADMIIVLAAAMKQAGELDQAKVAQALINLKDLPTLEGVMSWAPDATSEGVHGSMVEWQVQKGQFVLVNALE